MTTAELLHADELMHLALHATEHAQHGSAIEYLRRLLALQPDNAEAHYLLGAQFAQIGMPAQAVQSMSQALTLRPDLLAARFQLGLLWTTIGQTEEAEQVWKSFDALDEAHPFRLFKDGLLHVARNQFAQGIALLERGMAANRLNAPLNGDMVEVIRRARGLQAAATQANGSPPQPEGTAEAGMDVPPMFLDAYTTGQAR